MKKRTGWVCILLLFSGMVIGCSSRSDMENRAMKQKETKIKQQEVPFDQPLPHDYTGTLSMWSWDDDYYKTITEAFQKKYPNVTFECTRVEHKDLPQKYETALIVGSELPDIAWSVIDSRGEVFELDMWEPLEQEPYCFDISQVYEYLHPHLVNTKGNVCGIEQSLSPAGLAYRRDLAKEYLGTDDPEELECMMPDWESFIEKGKEVYEKSDGKVYMCFSLGDMRQFTQEQEQSAWVNDNEIDVERTFGRSLRLTCRFRDEHIADNLIAWTPAWNAAMAGDEHIFTACATWSVKFTIESHDPEGEKTGRWGLMSAPEGNANWGGTAMGITKTCRDKRLAWEFLKFATLSTEGARALNSIGLMTTAKQPYEEDPGLKSYKSKWFGDQDVGISFMEKIIPNMKTRALTPADGVIHDNVSLILNAMNTDKTITDDDALELLKKELTKELPDVKVY